MSFASQNNVKKNLIAGYCFSWNMMDSSELGFDKFLHLLLLSCLRVLEIFGFLHTFFVLSFLKSFLMNKLMQVLLSAQGYKISNFELWSWICCNLVRLRLVLTTRSFARWFLGHSHDGQTLRHPGATAKSSFDRRGEIPHQNNYWLLE